MTDDWRASAACRGRPTAWWYADNDSIELALARSICNGCPVAGPCLADADHDGIRAGLDPRQRTRPRSRAARDGWPDTPAPVTVRALDAAGTTRYRAVDLLDISSVPDRG